MTIEKILSRLPSHFNKSVDSNNYKALSLVADMIDDSEKLYDMILKFWDVDQAEGYGLDRLGKDEGISRGSYDDETYRKMINVQFAVNMSAGDIESINTILDAYMEDDFLYTEEMWNHPIRPEPAALKVNYNLFSAIEMPKTLFKRIKAGGVRATWSAYAHFLLDNTFTNDLAIGVLIKTTSNPWAQAGLGNSTDMILLNGDYSLDGNRLLNGFYNKDGPAHLQHINLKMNVFHEFGIHEVNLMPSLDGAFNLDGEILLQNEPQNKKLVILHDARMRNTQREVIAVSSQHSVPIKASSVVSNGVASLDGQVNLDGTMSLDQALYNHSGLFRVKKDGETVEEVAI